MSSTIVSRFIVYCTCPTTHCDNHRLNRQPLCSHKSALLFCECSTLSLCLNIAAVGLDPATFAWVTQTLLTCCCRLAEPAETQGSPGRVTASGGARSPTPVAKCSQCPQGGTTIGQSSMDNLHVCVCVCVCVYTEDVVRMWIKKAYV